MPEDFEPRGLTLRTNPEQLGSVLLASEARDEERVVTFVERSTDGLSDARFLVTIDDPQTLLALGQKMLLIEQTSATIEPQTALYPGNHGAPQSTLPVTSIRVLRIGILAPISPGDLTPTELNGGVDGPAMSSLIQSWRQAFRSLPDVHSIERVQFDMRCREQHEPRHIVRLLQEISTVMYMKARRNLGRELGFEVLGCDERKKQWLEASLPGGKSV